MFVVGRAGPEQVAAVQGAECGVLGMISRKDLVDPEHLRRANNAYGASPGENAIAPRPGAGEDGDDDDDDDGGLVSVPMSSARKGPAAAGDAGSSTSYQLAGIRPMLHQRLSSSSDAIDDSIDDELVEGDSSDTVVAQERLSMRPHRSVADLLQTIKEHAHASPSSSLRREAGQEHVETARGKDGGGGGDGLDRDGDGAARRKDAVANGAGNDGPAEPPASGLHPDARGAGEEGEAPPGEEEEETPPGEDAALARHDSLSEDPTAD